VRIEGRRIPPLDYSAFKKATRSARSWSVKTKPRCVS